MVGAGRTLWDDLRAVRGVLEQGAAVLAVNHSILFFEGTIEHAVSHHADSLPHLVALRRLARRGAAIAHSTKAAPGIDRVWPKVYRIGDSGLLAARIAVALGFARVVLAGVPMDERGHFYEDPGGATPPAPSAFKFGRHRKAWETYRAELVGRVVSMSGWTRQLLGGPELLGGLAC